MWLSSQKHREPFSTSNSFTQNFNIYQCTSQYFPYNCENSDNVYVGFKSLILKINGKVAERKGRWVYEGEQEEVFGMHWQERNRIWSKVLLGLESAFLTPHWGDSKLPAQWYMLEGNFQGNANFFKILGTGTGVWEISLGAYLEFYT